ncbi:lytic transglycosylase domain-containing protein [Thiomonas sp.]
MTPIALLHQCVPKVATVTMAAIVQQESGGNPLAIHDNTSGQSYRPRGLVEAVTIARQLIASGHSVDLGLAQINSKNLPALSVTPESVFDPCTNLRAAQTILLSGWRQSGGDLRGALSVYNTGKASGPVGANYGAGVYAKAGVVVPAIPGGRLASWVSNAIMTPAVAADLPPVRPVVTWTPQASPLSPVGGGLAAARW